MKKTLFSYRTLRVAAGLLFALFDGKRRTGSSNRVQPVRKLRQQTGVVHHYVDGATT